MEDSIVVVLKINKRKCDIEIPLDITARELVVGLNSAYELNIDTNNIKNCYLKVENPIMLLRGNMLLRESSIRNGSVIHIAE